MKQKCLALLNIRSVILVVAAVIVVLGSSGCSSRKVLIAGFYSNYIDMNILPGGDNLVAQELDLKTDSTFIYLQYRMILSDHLDDTGIRSATVFGATGRYSIFKNKIILTHYIRRSADQMIERLDKHSIMFDPINYPGFKFEPTFGADTLSLKIHSKKIKIGKMKRRLSK